MTMIEVVFEQLSLSHDRSLCLNNFLLLFFLSFFFFFFLICHDVISNDNVVRMTWSHAIGSSLG